MSPADISSTMLPPDAGRGKPSAWSPRAALTFVLLFGVVCRQRRNGRFVRFFDSGCRVACGRGPVAGDCSPLDGSKLFTRSNQAAPTAHPGVRRPQPPRIWRRSKTMIAIRAAESPKRGRRVAPAARPFVHRRVAGAGPRNPRRRRRLSAQPVDTADARRDTG
jgi:hypothetical protein